MLAVSGSPRAGGNTERLLEEGLDECAKAGWAVARFYLSERTVLPCIGCESCLRTGECALEGDNMADFAALLAESDALLIGTPVYYRNVTAQLKALIDRCHGISSRNLFRFKPVGALAVGRGEGGGQAMALAILSNFALSAGAVAVPGELNGVSARAGDPGDIESQPKRLLQARALAKNVMACAGIGHAL
jgi:multimeric flavodoxin WrbA